MVAGMARITWRTTQLAAVAVVAACALLVGCASSPSQSGTNQGEEVAPDTIDSAETGDYSDPASCLIGTWQEDLAALTRTAAERSKSTDGGDLKMKWSGGAFLRLDHKDMFFVWTEDSTFEMWVGDSHTRSITNGNSVGDYVVEGDTIHWSNYSTLNGHLVTYEDGVLMDQVSIGDLGDFSIPGAFTCTKDKLEMFLGDDRLSIPRFYDRIADKSPNY